MKHLLRAAPFLLLFASNVLGASRAAEWRKVEAEVRSGQAKSAIATLETIITAAAAEQEHAEMLKALGRKIVLEGIIQGNKPETKITLLQAEIAKAPAAIQPLLEALLAHWYWHYFQQNRWRFLQRTATAVAPGPDLRTWDLPRILGEIDRHFTAALADDATLKAAPIHLFDPLFDRGNLPDAYRPTLFDFLAHEALRFYQAGEQAGTRVEDAFELDAATTPIFADTVEFLAWQPASNDDTSPTLKAVRLFQTLLRFHRDDADRTAFHDADLARIAFGLNRATGDERKARYVAAMERFIAAAAQHEVSARARAALGATLHTDGESVRAHAVATLGREAFPNEAGGIQCYNLLQQIEAKSAALETERVWNAPWPTLNVTYRNVTHVYFRAVVADFKAQLARSRWNFAQLDEEQRTALLLAPPALAWNAPLPATTDYQSRTERLAAPTTLHPGFYYIFASHDETFSGDDSPVSVASVWVSTLALMVQAERNHDAQGGFVLDARGGEPIAGATVRVWKTDREGWFRSAEAVDTDRRGRFEIAHHENNVMLLAEHRGQAIASSEPVRLGGLQEREPKDSRTVFFTDRALYRPGQSIHYKGIALRYDQDAGDYDTPAGKEVVVVLSDPNDHEVARAMHKTNAYGSFSGTFTAPRDRLSGAMRIHTADGDTRFNVEEYKRPKFQVEIGAPLAPAKLDTAVELTGKATAYTGAAIDGASVRWRVERGVQCPAWCWWWQPPANQAIAHGSAVTTADGTFVVRFSALPDRSVPTSNEPVFSFTIHADITDTTGETRSQQRVVRVGYTALQAEVRAAEWQTPAQPVEFEIETRTLDSEPSAVRGTLTVHALRQPAAVERAPLPGRGANWWRGRVEELKSDRSNPETWEPGAEVATRAFATDAGGFTKVALPLTAGIYRAALETQDRFGRKVVARHTLRVVEPERRQLAIREPNLLIAPKWSVEPGETFTALWGTGYDRGQAFVEIECNGKTLQSYWTTPRRTQHRIEQEITEEMRGGFTLRVTCVRENRAYINERIVDVPWSDRKLTVKWERFRSKLQPGQKETWTVILQHPDARRAAGEMVAALYDASLDQFLPHRWPQAFGVFRREQSRSWSTFTNAPTNFLSLRGSWHTPRRDVTWSYRAFPADLIANGRGWNFTAGDSYVTQDGVVMLSAFEVSTDRDFGYFAANSLSGARTASALTSARRSDVSGADFGTEDAGAAAQKLQTITPRRNLNETAFFLPHVLADRRGRVTLAFTMPEALTGWKLLGFAHDKRLRAGLITDKAVTAKDLMIQPNPPRFVREGDTIEFTVKVSNQSEREQRGTVRLTFADAATLESADAALGNRVPEQTFVVPARQSRSLAWRIAVPDGAGFLTYKAVGSTNEMGDGEEGFLPVLSRRVLVTESLALPIRGKGTRQFEFTKLLDAGKSATLRHESLTVQMVSQPAWHAVMALPYLMEFPHECSEQVFQRLYANALARQIANSNPSIRRVFDAWKNTPALDSPLEKNADLKSVLLEETPWLRQAKSESAARRNVGVLFDAARLDAEAARMQQTLSERQLSNGMWPWFPGGPPNEYISLTIVTGFGRLRHLGAKVDAAPAIKALRALDAWMDQRCRSIGDRERYVPSSLDALYLYGRSFFLTDLPVAESHRESVEFLQRQTRRFWLRLDCRQSQAHLALALRRFGDTQTPQAIVKSFKERSVVDAELGMFWRDLELSWWWFRAPIETQALMIEAFAEIAEDATAVEDCKVWLLKQKQTQDWKTTKATADAVYALMLRGENLLGSDALVAVALGGETVRPAKTEVGTGFYETKFAAAKVTPALGKITVTKTDDGVGWGSVHWQYLEDQSRLTPHTETPLKLRKTLFIKETTSRGSVLKPVTGALAVGDELVVRLELRTDRDMEYLHLKDQRGSGTEPVNVVSRYRQQDGLGYYESTRDTASHFFVDYLPKGTYVFEYATRVQLKGRYQSGIAEIQCMYAPEFNSHSESFALEVR